MNDRAIVESRDTEYLRRRLLAGCAGCFFCGLLSVAIGGDARLRIAQEVCRSVESDSSCESPSPARSAPESQPALLLLPAEGTRENVAETASPPSIDVSGFRDGAHHWRRIRDDSRIIQALPDQPAYDPSQVREIVDNILLFQRENGGWPKDYDMLAILTDEQKEALRATHAKEDTSFDNHNIHSQVDYLARASVALGEPAWREPCRRGFDFLLAAQLPGGGFPQRFPRSKGYAAHITFNDGVMIGVLNVLKDAADSQPHWNWLDDRRRAQAREAVTRGVACILKCQIRVDGLPTGWCQQHDAATYEAAPARTFELASICPQETTAIVRFLMRFDSPDRELVAATDAAVVWLRKVVLQRTRVKRIPAPVEEFLRHRADFDVIVVEEEGAPALWARHYEIGTDKPVFAGRDGIKRYALQEIERERRTGTPWYGNWPKKLVDREYAAWRKRMGDPP